MWDPGALGRGMRQNPVIDLGQAVSVAVHRIGDRMQLSGPAKNAGRNPQAIPGTCSATSIMTTKTPTPNAS